MRIPGADKAIKNLMKWAEKDQWDALRDDVYAEHFGEICEHFGVTTQEITDLLGDSFEMLFSIVIEDIFTSPAGEEGEINIIDDYLKRRGWRETVPAKRYFEAMRDSVLSLHEVIGLDRGKTMTVQDLIMGGDPVTVSEKSGSEATVIWDRIAARVVTVNGKAYFTGSLLLFQREWADEVLSGIAEMAKTIEKEFRREARAQKEKLKIDKTVFQEMALRGNIPLFTQVWLGNALEKLLAPPPEIRNTDGEEIVFSHARFPILHDVTELAAALDEICELERAAADDYFWNWIEEDAASGNEPEGDGLAIITVVEQGRTVLGNVEIIEKNLILSTNSIGRATMIGTQLRSQLDGLIGPPLTMHQTLEQFRDQQPETPPENHEIPADVAQQAVHSYMDGHYRQVLDEALPVLGGKTPRQATKTKAGRKRVIDWLKQLENTEARRAARQGQEPYDTCWMWRELKIDYPA